MPGKYEVGENAIMNEILISKDILLELAIGIGYYSISSKKYLVARFF
jgi:hypothetical protein